MLIHVWTIKYLQFYQCGSISSKQMNDVPEVNLTLCDNVSSASFTIFETSIFQYVVIYLSTYFLTFIHVYLVLQLVVNQNRWLFHMCSVLQKKNKIPIFSSMDNTHHIYVVTWWSHRTCSENQVCRPRALEELSSPIKLPQKCAAKSDLCRWVRAQQIGSYIKLFLH